VVEVVHVTPTVFAADSRGGGERYPLELARAMAELVPTRLVTFGRERRRAVDGALEIRVLATRGHWRGGVINPLAERLPAALVGARVVHSYQYRSIVANACILAGRGLRKPVFCTDLGGSARHYAFELRLDRLVSGFLGISRFSVDEFPLLGRRSAVIYGGVDITRFRPDPAVSRRREVVFVGRVMPHKGIDVLIRAMPGDTPLHVYGPSLDAGYRAALDRLAVGKRVEFHDDAPDEEIVAAYRRARVAVLPSVRESVYGHAAANSELLGLVLLEAMACGTPVIGSDVGGIPEIVGHGQTGFVVPAGDAAALGERVRELLGGGRVWDSMSAAGVERVRGDFTWRRVAERCLEAYDTGRTRGRLG
jgi:glycosyltransferase involved in cell wall biosynthesis